MTFLYPASRIARVAGPVAVALVLALAVPALAATVSVSIVDKAFDPAEIVIHQGDTVTWTVTQSNGEPHTVTSGTPGGTDPGSLFNSQDDDPQLTGLKDNGGSYSFTFEKAGTFAYFCVVHPVDMVGTVVVVASGEEPGEHGEAIPPERKLTGAAILAVTLIILFGVAFLWRRMNPA